MFRTLLESRATRHRRTGGAALSQLWLFIVAPLIGGAIAGVVAKARIFEKD